MGMLSRQPQAPEWYRAKYFDYLKSTPEWKGAKASSPTQPAVGTRVEGAPSYEDEQLAAEQQARLKANWDRQIQQMSPGDPDLREHLGGVGAGQEEGEEDIPWWDRARRAAQDAAQGVVNQITAPAQLAPGEQSASDTLAQVPGQIGEAVSNAPTNVGEALSGLGTAARQVFPAPPPVQPGRHADRVGQSWRRGRGPDPLGQ
jgi:hypothetical protein